MANDIRQATRTGNAEMLSGILSANPDTPLGEPRFTCFLRTPLHVAATHGYVEFARVIANTQQGRQLALEVDTQGCTPLHLASTRYNVKMVDLLITANPDACLVPDQNGGTPLHLAAMRDEVKVMHSLIQSQPEAIHKILPGTNETILHLCVKHNKFRALKKLVDYLVTNREHPPDNIQDPISLTSADSDGNTILHLAARMKRMKMLKYLIKSDDMGVDINIPNHDGLTALRMLDRNEMKDVGISCYDYHNTREEPQQSNEWLKERLNALMIVAALIAGVAFQAVINPPGGVFQEDSKVDSITDPLMFTYYLRNVISNRPMSEGFQSYFSHLPPQKTARGNSTAYDKTMTYRAKFVKDLLTAAKNSESYKSVYLSRKLAPGIVLEDDWWMNITSKYNSTMGGGSGFSPYLIRYAGTAILAYTSPKAYQTYIVYNSLSLVVCGLTILVVTFDAIKQSTSKTTTSIVVYLEVLLAIAVACIGLSYAIAVETIGPPFYWHSTIYARLTIILGVVIMPFAYYFGLSLHPLTKRHFGRLRQYVLDRPFVEWLIFLYASHPRPDYIWLGVKLNLFYWAFLGLWAYFYFS